jgi:hypothetical protein
VLKDVIVRIRIADYQPQSTLPKLQHIPLDATPTLNFAFDKPPRVGVTLQTVKNGKSQLGQVVDPEFGIASCGDNHE